MSLEKSLLEWYWANRRHMPWREDPTPYHVYLSEIMLQQTQVDTVIPYYLRFLDRFPTLSSLADADEEEVLKLWEGLGYYSRGRNLHRSAEKIKETFGGAIPMDKASLLSLSGIGEYTSKAIRSIAFHQKEIAVDGNLIRVFSRLEESQEDNLQKMKDACENYFLHELQKEDPSAFNQALMDLGETVCLPHATPLCDQCPLFKYCKAGKDHTALAYPPPKKAKAKKTVPLTVFLLTHDGRIAIRKRPDEGLLASLYEFENVPGELSQMEAKDYLSSRGFVVSSIEDLGKGRHVFSHLVWMMRGYRVELGEIPSPSDALWVNKKEVLTKYPLPSAFDAFKKKIGL